MFKCEILGVWDSNIKIKLLIVRFFTKILFPGSSNNQKIVEKNFFSYFCDHTINPETFQF